MTGDPDRFGLALSAYLGIDAEAEALATGEALHRLAVIGRTAGPAAALAEAEGAVVAALAFLESVVGPDDMAEALVRCAAGCRRRAARDTTTNHLVTRGEPR